MEPMRLNLPVGAAVMVDGTVRWRLAPAADADAHDPLARALLVFEYAPPRNPPRDTEGWLCWKEEVRAAAIEAAHAAAAAAACFGAGVMEVRVHERLDPSRKPSQ
jgi:hypothetical protein